VHLTGTRGDAARRTKGRKVADASAARESASKSLDLAIVELMRLVLVLVVVHTVLMMLRGGLELARRRCRSNGRSP
jgi:hypothetical protein